MGEAGNQLNLDNSRNIQVISNYIRDGFFVY